VKILLAEDDLISRRLVEQVLESAGYEVLCVSEGDTAAAVLCSDDGPRLALIDWMMPGMDGLTVCREVRRKREDPYVYMILLTVKENKEDVIAGLEAGADDYLKKPVHPAELKARLRSGRRILELEDKLIRAREEMRFKASHDALTSLWNRGFVLELMQRELERARRERAYVAVLLCDLDHFKDVNDQYGHLIGDEVMRETARRLLASVRSYDTVGRYGGEEFIVLLTGCDSALSMERAEQIRAAIAERPVRTDRGPISITTSIGVVSSEDWGYLNGEQFLREADAALYRAKAAGRNRLVVAYPESVGNLAGDISPARLSHP
jgi:two-component system cell cycle response regulator